MSYCRWSSDNFNCDVYCYEDVNGGWTTWVAGNRAVGEIPKVPELTIENIDSGEWLKANKIRHEFLLNCERKSIDLPHAGAYFNDSTLKKFCDRLVYLRDLGYRIPEYVFDDIYQEMQEEKD